MILDRRRTLGVRRSRISASKHLGNEDIACQEVLHTEGWGLPVSGTLLVVLGAIAAFIWVSGTFCAAVRDLRI